MHRTQVAHLKAHLSQYLARVRRGDTVIVCDRNTPIARLVPYAETEDGFVVHEPTGSIAGLDGVPGLKPKRRVNIGRLLRESRDQR